MVVTTGINTSRVPSREEQAIELERETMIEMTIIVSNKLVRSVRDVAKGDVLRQRQTGLVGVDRRAGCRGGRLRHVGHEADGRQEPKE